MPRALTEGWVTVWRMNARSDAKAVLSIFSWAVVGGHHHGLPTLLRPFDHCKVTSTKKSHLPIGRGPGQPLWLLRG